MSYIYKVRNFSETYFLIRIRDFVHVLEFWRNAYISMNVDNLWYAQVFFSFNIWLFMNEINNRWTIIITSQKYKKKECRISMSWAMSRHDWFPPFFSLSSRLFFNRALSSQCLSPSHQPFCRSDALKARGISKAIFSRWRLGSGSWWRGLCNN